MTSGAAFVFYGQEKEILLRRYASLANREFTINKSIEYGQRRSRDHHLYPGGGDINIIVADINIGAQSYWNAEATMLIHTRGLLIMTEEATMPLTGKKALGFSGSVSAGHNIGIGGAEIGRAVVNFEGPIIFVVTARYHCGTYVVFSKALNENLYAGGPGRSLRLGHRGRTGRRSSVPRSGVQRDESGSPGRPGPKAAPLGQGLLSERLRRTVSEGVRLESRAPWLRNSIPSTP